jgi:4-amino-4-deoxy-L-arabinose transferase-like glycosyltransferase
VPSWLVFELAVTKLPHYVMPLYPAIAILIAGAVGRRHPRSAFPMQAIPNGSSAG